MPQTVSPTLATSLVTPGAWQTARMAEKEVEDAVFWLPPEFLATEEAEEELDDIEGFTMSHANEGYTFPTEFPFDWVSPMGSTSPGVDSFLTETESEEDGFASFSGKASLRFYQGATEEGKDMASSPQSTLWEGPLSELESPLSPLKSQKHPDLVCDAVTHLVRISTADEQQQQQSATCLSPSGRTAASPTTKSTGSTAAAWSSPVPVPALQKLQVNPKQRGAWGKHGKSAINEGTATYGGGPLGLPSSAWPPLKQPQKTEAPPPQSATSMAILEAPTAAANAAPRKDSYRESTREFQWESHRESYGGTGVFLPRNNLHLNNRPPVRRKKPAPGTPVLLPARVVEALKLDVDENGSIRRMPHAIILDHDAIVSHNMTLLHRRGLLPRSAAAATSAANQDTARLPPEWTY